MARSPKGGGSGGKGGSMFAGILLGIMLGLIAAGAIAWFVLQKNPASFEDKIRSETPKPEVKNELSPPLVKPDPVVASAPLATAPAVAEPKQHFTFYKELTDNSARKTPAPPQVPTPKEARPAPQPAKTASVAGNAKEKFFVQAGSFTNESDAEKLKAKLALLGMEASLQTADIPNKGTYHRVRLGPFNGSDETNKTLALLKQNGVANATSFKAQ